MIVLYDYESKGIGAQPIYTAVKELNDKVIAKILVATIKISQDQANKMIEKGKWIEGNWWSEDKRYSVEISNE